MDNEDLPIEELDEKDKLEFDRCSIKTSFFVTAGFVVVLILVWDIFGTPSNVFTAVHPRNIFSIPAILFSNFFHVSKDHLINNLIAFVPLGFFVFKLEGRRGLIGLFIGMLVAGATVWLFETSSSVTAGFSGAVMACWGILFVSVIRRDYLLVIVFLFLSYVFMEFSLFETIRPTSFAKANNVSWLGHLGGIIGGMASQIRSLPVALELLYKEGKVTKEEFIAIASRINKDVNAEVSTEDFDAADSDNQETVGETQRPKSTPRARIRTEKSDGALL